MHLLAALLVAASSIFAAPEITEFMADNDGALLDVDGAASDWIEIANPASTAADLTNWALSDDAAVPLKWRFPAVSIPPGGSLIVFASAKNRAVAGVELHTNFSLNAGGEYLALVRPDGAVASGFAPAFPAQRKGASFGTGREDVVPPLVSASTPSRILCPSSNVFGTTWTAVNFNANTWTVGVAAAGYDDLSPDASSTLMGAWNFDSAGSAVADFSGRGNNGTITGATFTAAGGGRSGGASDRAMDFGSAGTGKNVRIANAATGAFDAAVAADRLTVSLWQYGGAELPVNNSIFYGTQNSDGGGLRRLNVHLPWSDSNIYFDTGTGETTNTRIVRLESNALNFKGRWNHYLFLKNGPHREIWQNGVKWCSGEGGAPLETMRGFWIGSANSGAINFPGKVDDFGIWSAALSETDIAALAAGAAPVTVGKYPSLIGKDVRTMMKGVSASALIRIPFTLATAPDFDALTLRLRYDDGCVIYLNGVEILRRNVPAGAIVGSVASGNRLKRDVLSAEEIDLSAHTGLLQAGANVLAIHGFNDSATSGDFLIVPELIAGHRLVDRFFTAPTPNRLNNAGLAGFVADTQFSVNRGYFDAPFATAITTATPAATVRYTTDATVPAPGNGVAAPSPLLNISGTTVVRAMATKDDFVPTNTDTHTFIFTDGVGQQPVNPAGFRNTWGLYHVWGPVDQPVPADYEMDPEVVNAATEPGHTIRDALRALPALCLSLPESDLFDAQTGFYANADQRGDEWERRAAVEWIETDGTTGFHAEAGLRAHGGASRLHWHTPKHSMRLDFRGIYGASRLKHRIFPDSQVDTFDRVMLQACSTDSFAVQDVDPNEWPRARATYMRDIWMKDTQLAMGRPAGHCRYIHLYLNGLYWGVYHVTEDLGAEWHASYQGGDASEYDVLKDLNELDAGDRVAWDQLHARLNTSTVSDALVQEVQGRNPDGTRNPALPVLLDVPNLIDYMILHIFAAARDWPNHNWWAGRRRGPLSEGFRFYSWDQEITNMNLTWTTTYSSEVIESVASPGTPAFLYDRLRQNARFRRDFGDRVQELMFNGGVLTRTKNNARWQARQAQLDAAIIAESARWGDSRQTVPLTRPANWLPEMTWMENTWWAQNPTNAIQRFRNVALFPTLAAPTFSKFGGKVAVGTLVAITAPAGATAFYTTDGSEPVPGGKTYSGVFAITADTTLKARAVLAANESPLVSARFTVTPLASAANLVISEIHYHPATGGVEFIELMNVSAQTIDLDGVRLADAVDFTFPIGTQLAARQRIVLVGDAAAFTALYGNVPIAGQFTGQLSNGGELLRVLDASGTVIASVTFSDTVPWPPSADGDGYSLTLIRPAAGMNLNDPANWRASGVFGGSPDSSDAQIFSGGNPNADADRDGLTAFAEYALGTSDTDAASGRNAVSANVATGLLDVTFSHRVTADDAVLTPEISADLFNWQSGPAILTFLAETPPVGGIAFATYRAILPPGITQAFVRVRVQAR